MSSRTLLRKLAANHLSFQAIMDGLRRDLAIRYMSHTNRSLEEISQLIGFSSAAVFHRAFKKWTGIPPGEYRRHPLPTG